MKSIIDKTFMLVVAVTGMSVIASCVDDLDTVPIDKDDLVSEKVFGADIQPYEESLAKIYAGLVIGGNQGGDAKQDVVGIDGGSQASFIRVLWNMQELASDMAHCCWNDPGIPDFNHISWAASSPWIKGSYYRLFYQINLSNAYIRETSDGKLSERGCSAETVTKVKQYRAEARFMRALMYQYALDLYRNVPFVDENSTVGSVRPQQIMKEDLFKYIESEMLACESELSKPVVGWSDSYGHANRAAMWAALSRLYLNAETYIGENRYSDCITYSKKVIDAGYELEPVYGDMFRADNDHSREMILPLRYEGAETMTWGGMTALLCWGSAEYQEETNAQGAWQGVRAKSSLYNIFTRESACESDSRRLMLRTESTTNIEITNESDFVNNGIPVTKYYNVNKDGSKPASNQAYTDFPVFRLGEVYLNLAEAVLRGGQGATKADALRCINDLRRRAYNDKVASPISDSELDLDFILDERGREMFFEAQRRTDLVRFGKYTGSNYVWPWKGGVAEGRGVSDIYAVYPLPSDDIGSNENLKQNEGY